MKTGFQILRASGYIHGQPPRGCVQVLTRGRADNEITLPYPGHQSLNSYGPVRLGLLTNPIRVRVIACRFAEGPEKQFR